MHVIHGLLVLGLALATAVPETVILTPGLYTRAPLILQTDALPPTTGRSHYTLRAFCAPFVQKNFRFLPENDLCGGWELEGSLDELQRFLSQLEVKSPRGTTDIAADQTLTLTLLKGKKVVQEVRRSFTFLQSIPVTPQLKRLRVEAENATEVTTTLLQVSREYLTDENKGHIRLSSDSEDFLKAFTFRISDDSLVMTGRPYPGLNGTSAVSFWLVDTRAGLQSERFTFRVDQPSVAPHVTFFVIYALVLSCFFVMFFGFAIKSLSEHTQLPSDPAPEQPATDEVQVLSKSITEWSPSGKRLDTADSLHNRSTKNDTLAEIDIFGSHPGLERPEPELSFAGDDRSTSPAFEGVNLSHIVSS